MKSIFVIPLVIAGLLLGPSMGLAGQTPNEEGSRVRILSFNILHGETLKRDFDLDDIARKC